MNRLERLGVSSVSIEESESAYVPARMTLTIPWAENLELVWYRQWVSDGMLQEDCCVALKVGEMEERVVDIDRLFRLKLEKPLVDVIVDHIAEAVETRLRGPKEGQTHADEAPSEGPET